MLQHKEMKKKLKSIKIKETIKMTEETNKIENRKMIEKRDETKR